MNRHWIVLFHRDYQLKYLEWGCACLVEPPQCKVVEQFILSKFLLILAGCCNILLNRNFAAEIVGRMQERQLFLSSIAIRNASDDIQVFNENFVSCYVTVFSPLRFPGPEWALSSFIEYILCIKTCFHPRKSYWPSGNVRQSYLCDSRFESWWFGMFGLNFYISEWHGRAIFLHLPKDTCANAIGVLSRFSSLLCITMF